MLPCLKLPAPCVVFLSEYSTRACSVRGCHVGSDLLAFAERRELALLTPSVKEKPDIKSKCSDRNMSIRKTDDALILEFIKFLISNKAPDQSLIIDCSTVQS